MAIVFFIHNHLLFFILNTDVFEPFLRSYLEKFKYQTVRTKEWRHYLEEYFHDKVQYSTDVRSYMYRYLGGCFECHLWLAERCAEAGWLEILAPQTRFATCKHDWMVSYMDSEGLPENRNLPFSHPELKLVFTESILMSVILDLCMKP